jgi:hypothetical protein
VEVQFDLADDNFIWYSQIQRFGKIDVKNAKTISYAGKFKYQYFHHFAQNPKDPKHMVMSMRAWKYVDTDPSMVETRDGGETWHAIPGYWPVQTQRVYFSKTTDEVFTTGHAGTFIYDYKKFWEFLDSKITVMFNDKEISFSVMPEITNGRTMVPMRYICEAMGSSVEWDGATQSITIKRHVTTDNAEWKDEIKMTVGSNKIIVNGEEQTMDCAPMIVNGRTLVPARFIAQAMGADVNWNGEDRVVEIFV